MEKNLHFFFFKHVAYQNASLSRHTARAHPATAKRILTERRAVKKRQGGRTAASSFGTAFLKRDPGLRASGELSKIPSRRRPPAAPSPAGLLTRGRNHSSDKTYLQCFAL
ncbi:hypothetical protein EVAR_23597_1 [Eumeta japonica]|uniref:Uncharacterized protein n=1 Tax=Eumeta variegata TaxID=151549 RepID=A0A4C1WXG7_EUMVA|nr:hypothetical protein EVAR_23597_1 [Eumeta japonica]